MEEYYNNLLFNTILHILVLFILSTIFFWTIIVKTENKNQSVEINKSIDNLYNLQISNTIFTPNKYDNLMTNLLSSKKKATKNNERLFIFNIVIIIILLLIFTFTVFVKQYIFNETFNIWKMIGEKILIFTIIIVSDYIFFRNIENKHITTYQSYVPISYKKEINKILI